MTKNQEEGNSDPIFPSDFTQSKASAKKLGIDVAFRADFKLNCLTPFQFSKKMICQKAHQQRSVPCKKGVVYEIPLACCFRYRAKLEMREWYALKGPLKRKIFFTAKLFYARVWKKMSPHMSIKNCPLVVASINK